MNERLSSRELFWISITVILGILIYGRSLGNGFVWDDHSYVWKNPLILSWTGLKDIWFHLTIGEYYPVTSSFIWLEHKLWGLNPWGYHVTSLMLHTVNALLLFSLLRKVSSRLAGIITVLFMIHPVQVETVAWISEQKTLLCFLFLLLAFRAFLDFDSGHKKKDYVKTLFFFSAALLSKSIALCFAFVPLLHAWWKRDSLQKRDFLTASPFFLLGGMIAILHLHLIKIYDAPMDIPGPTLDAVHKILITGRIFFFYIQQIVFPKSFMTVHPKWIVNENDILDWLYPAGVVALYLLLFLKRRELGRGFFALLCFYALSLFPVLGLINFAWYRFSYVADHFAYLAVPSVLLLLYLGASFAFPRIRNYGGQKTCAPSAIFKKCIAGASALLIVYLSILSFHLTLDYKNDVILWTQALRRNPASSFPYLHLGELCSSTPGCTLDEAISLLQKSIRLKPDYLHSYMSLGECYRKKHDYEKALTTYKHAATLARPFTRILCYRFIADIHITQGRFTEARPYLEKAIGLEANPEYQKNRRPLQEASVHSDLGALCLMRGENHQAAQLFQDAITLAPQQANYYAGLGAAFMNLNDYKNAAQAFQTALTLDPQNTSLKQNLAESRKHLKASPQ